MLLPSFRSSLPPSLPTLPPSISSSLPLSLHLSLHLSPLACVFHLSLGGSDVEHMEPSCQLTVGLSGEEKLFRGVMSHQVTRGALCLSHPGWLERERPAGWCSAVYTQTGLPVVASPLSCSPQSLKILIFFILLLVLFLLLFIRLLVLLLRSVFEPSSFFF